MSEPLGRENPGGVPQIWMEADQRHVAAIFGPVDAVGTRRARIERRLLERRLIAHTLYDGGYDAPRAALKEASPSRLKYGVDQETPWVTFTRFAPPIEFSHTASMTVRPTSWPGTDPDTFGWTVKPAGERPRVARALDRLTGSIFLGFGLRLAIAERV